MAIIFANDGMVSSASGTAENITSSTWCVCFWARHTSDEGVVFSRSTGAGAGDTGWFFVSSNGLDTIALELRNGGAVTRWSNTSTEDGVLHHHLWVKYDGTLYFYLDGVSTAFSSSGALVDPGQPNLASNIGDDPDFLVAWSPWAGTIFDYRSYSNPAWAASHAAIAKIIFEERGGDGITDGLITRTALSQGTTGVNLVNGVGMSNLGSSGLHYSVITGTPKWTAEAVKA